MQMARMANNPLELKVMIAVAAATNNAFDPVDFFVRRLESIAVGFGFKVNSHDLFLQLR